MSDLYKVPAATVSGRDVSLHDLLAFLKQQDKLAFLHEAIEGLLVKQAIAQCGITVSDAELQGALDTFRRQHGLYKSAETRQWLEQQSMTSNDLEARLEYDVAAENLPTIPKTAWLCSARESTLLSQDVLSADR